MELSLQNKGKALFLNKLLENNPMNNCYYCKKALVVLQLFIIIIIIIIYYNNQQSHQGLFDSMKKVVLHLGA